MKTITFVGGPHDGKTAEVEDGEFVYWFRVKNGTRKPNGDMDQEECYIYEERDRTNNFYYRTKWVIPMKVDDYRFDY
jgi:hypothetical protein